MRIYLVFLLQTSEEVNIEPQCQGVQSHKASAVCGEMGWENMDFVFHKGDWGVG